jgi:phosphate transport system permease protein
MLKREYIAGIIFWGATALSAGVTLAVLCFMVILSLPIIKNDMILEVLMGPWSPDHGLFGILPMIVGTLCIALLSLIISFPVSLGCSIFIEIIRPDRPGRFLKKIVRLMTAVPTVIYGFVGFFYWFPK